jgi:predicted ArsR family transcriptional regulator
VKPLHRRPDLSETTTMEQKRRAVADPVRQRLLLQFYEARDWTAKELADALGVRPNGLYYHLRILEDTGFIGVVGTRAGRRMVERVYRGTNPGQRITWDIAEQPVEFANHLKTLLEVAKVDVEDAIFDTVATEPDRLLAHVESPAFKTTPEEIDEFRGRLKELVQEFRDRAKETAQTKTLRFTYALRERPVPLAAGS